MLFDTFAKQIRPRPRMKMLDWCRRYVQNENGRPYDHNAYPHLGAPGGPCDAFDDPQVRIIALQFASRLGKTFFGQCGTLFTAAMQPAPCMFVSASEKIAGEIIQRTYTLLEHCSPLVDQLAREGNRKQDCIELDNCRIFVGWARSVTTLADKNVKVGHANEIDKWERATTKIDRTDGEMKVHGSTEGDPLDLFLDRAKDFPNFKYILESTPSLAGVSRIEKARLASSNCAYWVPCPWCRQYQTMEMPRLTWEKDEGGHSNPDLAYHTAYYPCVWCHERIEDHHRAGMMRRGVWLPEGTGIDHATAWEVAGTRHEQLAAGTFSDEFEGHYCRQPYATGDPKRDGQTAGYQLSSLCALSLTWGVIAAKWLNSSEQTSRWNFINQWLGQTWKLDKRTEDWESVGRRIVVDVPQLIVPMWGSFLTCGIDRQQDHYKYIVTAWGPGSSAHVIDYGEHETLDWIHQNIVLRDWEHADGGTLRIAKTLIDSGYDPAEPYQYSRDCLNAGLIVLCCKGSSVALQTSFRDSVLGEGTMMPGLPLIMVDPNWTQGELERRLFKCRPGDTGSLSLFAGSLPVHKDFLRQLLNDEPQSKRNARGNPVVTWNRATDYPNDFRDCFRYADVAHLMWVDGGSIPPRVQLKNLLHAGPTQPSVQMEDGRPFLLLERDG